MRFLSDIPDGSGSDLLIEGRVGDGMAGRVIRVEEGVGLVVPAR
jgi:hypothetical protein